MDATALRSEAIASPREPARLFVLPGQVVVAHDPSHLVTILGSCVSVCLFDAKSGVGGLNHIVFSGVPSGEAESDPCKWSTPAMERLTGQIIAAGARMDRLQAKVFGGAQVTPGPSGGVFRLGERNVEAALWELDLKKIPVLAKDTGGHRGRKLVFESHTGRVWV